MRFRYRFRTPDPPRTHIHPEITQDTHSTAERIIEKMRFIEALATAFINTFGITQPTDQTRRRAAWFILGMLILVAVALFTAVAIVFHMM